VKFGVFSVAVKIDLDLTKQTYLLHPMENGIKN